LAQTALALLLLALGLMIWDRGSQPMILAGAVRESPVYTRATIDRINQHLQQTEKQSDLSSLAMEVENANLAPAARVAPPIVAYKPYVSPYESEDTAGQVYQDLEPSAGSFDRPHLPEDRIDALIEQRQWLENYNRRQTEQFIRAVKQNARAAGYDLQINNELKVTNVRRIPNAELSSGKPSGAQ
jgi:hypothetical protein